jgi:large subunit ribosomal protein L15
MKFHELNTIKKSTRRRVGRGISAGQGKTAGRGTKGQHARTGFKRRSGFEGGQTPLVQRIPKARGFKSLRAPAQVVYTDSLNLFNGKVVTNETLAKAGFIANPYQSVKIILRGELKKTLDVQVDRASEQAVKMIEKVGGKFASTPTPRQNSAKQSKE